MKKVFLDDLPRWKKGALVGRINWQETVGYKVKFIYDDIEGEIEIVDYEREPRFLYIKYQNKNFKINIGSFQECHLGKVLLRRTDEFKIEIGTQFKDDKRDLIITDRGYRKNKKGHSLKFYKYTCNKCGYKEGWIIEGNILFIGAGCACCAGKVVEEGINDIPTTAPELIKYFQGGYNEAKKYSKGSKHRIYPICPDCGTVYNKKIEINNLSSRKSLNCIMCSDGISYPNKFMYNILEQLNINFKSEYSPEWIKPKRYDFYFELNNNKYIIEMDGGFHKKDNLMNGKSVQENKGIDNYKDKLANENGIEVIRIDCEFSDLELIKNNLLNSKLLKLFNLNIVDWLKTEEFALSNRVKEACDMKMANPDMTTTEIGKIMKLNRNTIAEYLKRGNKLGWCNYDSNQERIKNINVFGKKWRKQIEVFKNGISLGIFESVVELSRQSGELFGVELNDSSISISITRKKEYKGFVFRHV